MKHLYRIVWLSMIAVSLAGCAGGVPTLPPEIDYPIVPSPTALQLSTDFRPLTVTAADGVLLAADFYPPPASPARGALLLHMVDGCKEDWIVLATRLQGAGYAVLALDLRGHGASGGQADWSAMPGDVARAWTALIEQPEVDPQAGVMIGASVGANLALAAAAANPDVRAVVLLSPGLDYRGIQTEPAMAAYDERPALIVASEDDTYAANSARRLAELAQGPHTLTLYADAGHGVEMFERQPDLSDLILGWLQRYGAP